MNNHMRVVVTVTSALTCIAGVISKDHYMIAACIVMLFPVGAISLWESVTMKSRGRALSTR
jgi:hypothetical protein